MTKCSILPIHANNNQRATLFLYKLIEDEIQPILFSLKPTGSSNMQFTRSNPQDSIILSKAFNGINVKWRGASK